MVNNPRLNSYVYVVNYEFKTISKEKVVAKGKELFFTDDLAKYDFPCYKHYLNEKSNCYKTLKEAMEGIGVKKVKKIVDGYWEW